MQNAINNGTSQSKHICLCFDLYKALYISTSIDLTLITGAPARSPPTGPGLSVGTGPGIPHQCGSDHRRVQTYNTALPDL